MKYHAGGFLLDDAPWSGRPVGADSDQIETLTENNQCYTTQETGTYLKYPNQELLVKMKNVSLILWKKTKWTF